MTAHATQDGPAVASPRLVYITARGHSGSTLLEMMLGAHPAGESLGELKALARKRGNACRCGAASVPDCPFWSKVDELLHRNSPFSLEELDTEPEDQEAFEAQNLALLQAAAEASGAEFVVDSSKSLRRLTRLDRIGLDVDVIVLRRSPLGVVCSNLRRGRDWRAESRRYTIATMKTRAYLEGRTVHELSYDALVRDPRGALGRLMQSLGYAATPEQFEWASQPSHTFAGNAMRFSTESTIRRDERWKRELSLAQKIGILWLTLPTRWRTDWLYQAHLPYWKGEGREAWRAYRAQWKVNQRRRRRHALIERYPGLRPWHARLRNAWNRVRRIGDATP